MRSFVPAVVLVALAGVVPQREAQAFTWTVGRDLNDCPGGCNFHDGSTGSEEGGGIERAMVFVSVVPGDTVLVYPRPGTPTDQICDPGNAFSIKFDMKSGVVLKSALGEGTVCIAGSAGADPGMRFVNASEATVVDGMTFQWDSGVNGFGGAIAVFVSSGVIKNCTFDQCRAGVGAGVYQLLSDVRIENSLFLSDSCIVGGGTVALSSSDPVVVNNTFFSCGAPLGSQGVSLYMSDSSPTISRNIIMESFGGSAVYCAGSNPASVNCNVFWDNPYGVFGGSCGDPTGTLNNVNANPGFCDAAGENFNLCVYSPALTGPCGTIGYVPSSGGPCGSCPTAAGVQLEAASWGRIKSLYR